MIGFRHVLNGQLNRIAQVFNMVLTADSVIGNVSTINDSSGNGNNAVQAVTANQGVMLNGFVDMTTSDYYAVTHNDALNVSASGATMFFATQFRGVVSNQHYSIISKGTLSGGWFLEYKNKIITFFITNTGQAVSSPILVDVDRSTVYGIVIGAGASTITFFANGIKKVVINPYLFPSITNNLIVNGLLNPTIQWQGDQLFKALKFKNSAISDTDALSEINTMHTIYALKFKKNIICDGNSLTFGTGGTLPYPTQLQTSLGTGVNVVNIGVSGQNTDNMIADAATQVDAVYYNVDNCSNILIAWEQTNQIGNTSDTSAVIYQKILDYCLTRRNRGFKVIVMTCIARASFTTGSAQEIRRLESNQLIRDNWSNFASAIVDLALQPEFDLPTKTSNLTYYNADGTHLVNAGYTKVKDYIIPVITPLI